jgi:clumping factor A
MKTMIVRALLAACLALWAIPRLAAAQLTQIYQENLKGSVVMTGNTLGRSGDQVTTTYYDRPGTLGSAFTWINDRLPATQDNTDWGDYTTGDWNDNYSYAELNLAALGGGAFTIRKVILFWTGSCVHTYNTTTEDVTAFVNTSMSVTLEYPTGPSTTATVEVSPGGIDDLSDDGLVDEYCNDGYDPNGYVAYADVTDIGPTWMDGMYAVGGVPGTQVFGNTDFAGWTLAVVFTNDTVFPSSHQVTIWSGWREQNDNSYTTPAPEEVNGFCYPDLGGTPLPGRLLVTAVEGDSSITGDAFAFGNGTPLTAADRLEGVSHPVDNFFAAQITDRDGNAIDGAVHWTQADHAPGAPVAGGRQGLDIADVPLNDTTYNPNVLAVNDTTAYLVPNSTQDIYSVIALALDLPTRSATFEMLATTTYTPSTVFVSPDDGVSDTIHFIIAIENVGEAPATDVSLVHPLPASVTALNDISYSLNGGASVAVAATLADLTGAGVPMPDVDVGDTLSASYTVTVSDDTPDPIVTTAHYDYSWELCGETQGSSVSSEQMTIDVAFCIGNTATGDSDGDGLCDDTEIAIGTDPNDADSDDDGVTDGHEPSYGDDTDGDGLINAMDPDSDNDGLNDGTEMGVTDPGEDTDTTTGHFIPDGDGGATTTDPLDPDTDDGGVPDGAEDIDRDGVVDPGETDPNYGADDVITDTDGDGIPDDQETLIGTDPNDGDSDDDGVLDGAEPNYADDTDGDGLINAMDPDSDGDGILDGTEMGVTADDLTDDTDVGAGNFVPDGDGGATTTSPVNPDTDNGGVPDGEEDADHDGVIDTGETDPNDPSDDVPVNPDGGPDADTDVDSDADGDADGDSDGDADGDSDADSDADADNGLFGATGSGALWSCTAADIGAADRGGALETLAAALR